MAKARLVPCEAMRCKEEPVLELKAGRPLGRGVLQKGKASSVGNCMVIKPQHGSLQLGLGLWLPAAFPCLNNTYAGEFRPSSSFIEQYDCDLNLTWKISL